MSGSKTKLNHLFSDAASSGIISTSTSTLLSGNLGNVVIAGAAGKDLEDIEATDVTLVTVLLDSSSSIGSRKLEQAVRDGYNLLLDTFACSKDRDSILLALWTFDSRATVIHSYVPVPEAASLDQTNYRAGGTTSLYDTWCDALAANIAYAQRLRDAGTPCRSVVIVITDGEDVSSKRLATHCAQISRDLLRSEQFLLAFVGVGDDVDFHSVAKNMGIPEGNILAHISANASDLRKAFQMVSQSAIRVSQSVVSPGGTGFFVN